MIRKCIYCKKRFEVETKRKDAKFCGYQCYWKWAKENSWRFSKKISKATKKGMASPEVIEKMRLAKLGKPRAGNPKNWKLSKNTKEKLKKAHKGRHHSPKTEFKKGLIPWNKGKEFMADEKHPNWKGDKVGYSALHNWIRKKLGKPKKCEHCGTTKGTLHWANKSGEYKRDLTDWISLCVRCHRKYDLKRYEKFTGKKAKKL